VLNIIQYLAATLGMAGSLLVALKKRSGFMCWIVGNILWVIFGFLIQKWGIVVQFIAFEIIAIYGYHNWKGGEMNEKNRRNKKI
jgi:nicotinamide riboside transporter PnuC